MKKIKPLGNRKFGCLNGNQHVNVDFNYLVDGLNLKGSFVLVHWNKIFRSYALYHSTADYYVTFTPTFPLTNLVGEYVEVFPTIPVLPTAAVLYRDCKLLDPGLPTMQIVPA